MYRYIEYLPKFLQSVKELIALGDCVNYLAQVLEQKAIQTNLNGFIEVAEASIITRWEKILNVSKVIDQFKKTSKSGNTVQFDDLLLPVAVTKLEVEGKSNQTGSGEKSPDNPYALTGTTKLTVSDNTTPHDYLLPQTLYSLPDATADTFEMVAGVGTQNVGKVVLNGTQTTFLFAQATSAGSVFKYYNAGNNTTGSITGRIQSDKLLEEGVGEWIYGKDSYYGGNVIAFCLLNSRTGIVVTDTADQKLAKLKTFLSANPITVLFQLATPIAITGAAQVISAYSPTTIVSADAGTVNVSLSSLDDEATLQARRDALKAKLMSKPPINLQVLKGVIEAYMGIGVDITVTNYIITVKYRGESRIADLSPLYSTVYDMIPANLLIDIAYAYLLWDELDAQNLTFDQLDAKNLIFDTLERGEWIA